MKFTNATDSIQLDMREAQLCTKKLEVYRKHLQKVAKNKKYSFLESSICLPCDAQIQKKILRCVRDTCSPKLKYIIVVGIGGSNLGVRAVYDALSGYKDVFETEHFPKLFFIDTLHAQWILGLTEFFSRVIDFQEILIVISSKSGTTLETIVGAEMLFAALERIKKISERVVVITDNNSKLWQKAKKRKWKMLAIPSVVGGRYSIFSSVGLFPLAAVGYDIVALCRGASEMREQCLSGSFDTNPAMQSAMRLFVSHKRGCVIHDTFIFSPQLESLGKWYRQLLGESIGKEYDSDGKRVAVGIVPTVSIGSTDLHSVGQLYLGGPKNIFTTFIRVMEEIPMRVPPRGVLHGFVKGIESRSLTQIMSALLDGTQDAYQKAGLPFIEATLDNISEYELGSFFQWKMMEIMYLAKLFNVNAFDQPNVEQYKKEARKRLNAL